jgi:hypothetical protein
LITAIGDPSAFCAAVTFASDTLIMDIAQVKWFLRAFADGKKLNKLTMRELYLSGYIGIELPTSGKDPLPTVITEKGKQILQA